MGSRMTEVRVHAAFKVKDETTFLKEAAKIVEATQAEQGCIHYQLYKEAGGGDSGSFAMIETWATQVRSPDYCCFLPDSSINSFTIQHIDDQKTLSRRT